MRARRFRLKLGLCAVFLILARPSWSANPVDGMTDPTGEVTVRVGPNEEFQTISQALDRLGRPVARNVDSVTLVLAKGFKMSEQVLIRGHDLGWVRITSLDDYVEVDREALTEAFAREDYGDGTIPAFGVSQGGRLPVIDAIFRMNGKGKQVNLVGVAVIGSGSVARVARRKGFLDAGWHNFYVSAGGSLHAKDAIGTGAGNNCLHVRGASMVEAPGINCSSSFHSGMNASDGAVVNVAGGNFSGSGAEGNGHDGIWANTGALVNAENADCSNVGKDGISANQGAKVVATKANVSGSGRYGLFAWMSGTIEGNGVIASGVGAYGVYAERGGRINFEGGNASGAKDKGIVAARGSSINALGAISRKGKLDSDDDTVVWAGGIINFVHGIGGMSQDANAITSNGIIFH